MAIHLRVLAAKLSTEEFCNRNRQGVTKKSSILIYTGWPEQINNKSQLLAGGLSESGSSSHKDCLKSCLQVTHNVKMKLKMEIAQAENQIVTNLSHLNVAVL